MRSPGAAKHRRRSIRLKGYDYSGGGAYFLTICTYHQACFFGEVVEGEMQLNTAGWVARKCWMAIPKHFPRVELDAFVIMPDHVHGIIWINDDPRAIAGSDNDDNIVGAKDISQLASESDNDDNIVGAKDISQLASGSDNDNNIVGAKDISQLASGSDNDNNIVGAKDFSPLPDPPNSGDAGVSAFRSPSKTVGSMVRGFKIGVTKWMRANTGVRDVWQRNYYEHIIRNETALQRIRAYIEGNPPRWADDGENTH